MQDKQFKDTTWWLQYLEAKPLELFVNLEDSEAAFKDAHPDFETDRKQPMTVAEFCAAYPDFAPNEWWTYRSNDEWNRRNDLQWRLNQKMLREVWEYWSAGATVGIFQLMAVILSVVNPEDVGEKKPTFGDIMEVDAQSTYYESLVWLNSQPWRAKTCEHCKRRFIASWPSNEHCSQHCAAIALREYKRKYREDRATQYNRNRRKARAKTHAIQKRRSNL
jgi:hypothetical protein